MNPTPVLEVWIVDDDASIRWVLERALKQAGMTPIAFEDADSALSALRRGEPDVLITDIRMPGKSGLDLLDEVRTRRPRLPVIVMTAHSDLDSAVAAYQGGAFEYLPKPFDIDQAVELVRRAATQQHRSVESATESRRIPEMLGQAPAMQEMFRSIGRLSRSSMTVLITGESGTGKELVARALHRHSPRATKPFIALNTSAFTADLLESELFGHEKGAFTGATELRRGRFEQADGGTLFLDEIGELKPDVQAKLLRALQESEIERVGGGHPIKVDLRIIAATNVDLEKAVREGRFREDLYYRINVIPMKVPPLRDRVEDISPLATFFISRYNAKFRKQVHGIEDSTLGALQAYPWPGNIRELENLMERLVAVSDKEWIGDEDLPYEYHLATLTRPEQVTEGLFDRACEMFERNFILKALERGRWNVTATARDLGMPLSTLKFKMDRLDIREIAKKLKGIGPGGTP